MLYDNLSVNTQGHLEMAGVDLVRLAEKYGTALYVLDEERIRSRCRDYLSGMREFFGEDALPLYASKALSFTGIYRLIAEEGLGTDVVSGGELYTAKKAGFPMRNIYFHGNNKTDKELEYGLDCRIGCFVVDNIPELQALDTAAARRGMRQKILLRITPGIDAHTFAAVQTGLVDSKFGSAIATGQAAEIVREALKMQNLELAGLHCHIGSQIFDAQPFVDSVDIMMDFAAEMRRECGFELSELNLGGGFGVPYDESEPGIDLRAMLRDTALRLREKCEEHGLEMPRVLMEPGRSIVADSGLTLYRVGSVKEIPGYKNYVAVDGGMGDNPRYALYQAYHSALVANRADKPADFSCTVAGRCCESDDVISERAVMQRPERGDIVAVLTTGAYNYSMASNYNRVPRPPVVMLGRSGDYIAVRRESYEDITSLDN